MSLKPAARSCKVTCYSAPSPTKSPSAPSLSVGIFYAWSGSEQNNFNYINALGYWHETRYPRPRSQRFCE